jgi:hypothetical protein
VNTDLFRKKALARYMRTDAPGGILTIAPPWSMALFATLAAITVALALLAIFGRAQMTAGGRGVVRPNAPSIALRAPFAATVLAVTRGGHEKGRAGETILTLDTRTEAKSLEACSAELATDRTELSALESRLADWNAHEREASTALVLLSQLRTQREKTTTQAQRCDALSSIVAKSAIVFPSDATLEDVAVTAGGQVREGDLLATLVPASASLVGYLALGEQYRSAVATGMKVRVKYDALPYDEVGAGDAHVVRVLDALPSGVKIEGAPSEGVFAELGLDTMPGGSGPPRTGMTFSADVLVRKRPVLALLFGTPE